MMREEEDGDEQRNVTKKNPLLWTVRSARRVRLAVRSSITSSVAKKPLFEDDDDIQSITITSGEDNVNIDQAMMGLHSLPDHQSNVLFPADGSASSSSYSPATKKVYDVSSLLNQSSSYIPQDDWDPILDGGYRDAAEEERSKELFDAVSNYEASEDWKMALARARESSKDLDSEDDCSGGDVDDDDAFGDFQSADTQSQLPEQETTQETESIRIEIIRTPPPASHSRGHATNEVEDERSIGSGTTFSTINTLGLCRRVDDLFSHASSADDNDLCITLSNDIATPALLAQTQDILARVARERYEKDQEKTNKSDGDADSDATPTTKSHRGSLSYATPSRQLSKEFGASKKVSMQLPITDLTSLEGRWTRRRQLESQAAFGENDSGAEPCLENLEGIMSDLPELYQIPLSKINDGPLEVNTAMLRILNSVPWGCANLDDQHGPAHDLSVWDDFITGQLSDLDSALQDVQKIMAASVKPAKLNLANNLVHTCERNLRLAKIYCDRTSQALESAVAAEPDGNFVGVGVLGNSHLLDLWQQKEDLTAFENMLERLDDVTAQEKEIIRRIDTFDATHSRAQDEYSEVIRLCNKLRGDVDGNLGRLESLSELRDSRLTAILEERFWDRLKHLSRQNVVRVCRQGETPSLEYMSLIKAASGLFEASQLNIDESKGIGSYANSHEQFDELCGWSKNIVDAIFYEAERCFASSLLEPIEAEDSAHVKDLRSLEHEIGKDWGDSVKLKTLTHNLVTIRFEFERSMCYLPRVIVRLCECLLDVLRGHALFHQIHCSSSKENGSEKNELFAAPESSAALLSVEEGLRSARNLVWEKCESVMIHALREYQNFASKTVLFRNEKTGTDDSNWEKELQGLHTVYCAIVCFLRFKPVFYGSKKLSEVDSAVNESPVLAVLEEITSEHLRLVHVEAMTTMGRMLSRETWYLVDLENPDDSEKKIDHCGASLSCRNILSASVSSVFQRHKGLASFYTTTPGVPFDHFGTDPTSHHQFLQPQRSLARNDTNFAAVSSTECCIDQENIGSIFDFIDTAMKTSSDNPYRIATQTIAEGLVEWAYRLLVVSLKVPLVCEKVCAAIENIFDLYYTTVFRLCAGSRRNERIVFGEDATTASSDSFSPFTNSRKRATSPLVRRGFGQERRSSGKPPALPYHPTVAISSTLDIEICAPMPQDMDGIAKARSFIDRAQQELHGNVNLNRVDSWIGDRSAQDDPEEYACAVAKSVERRQAAAWSCLVVSGLAEVVLSVMASQLEALYGVASRVQRFKAYVESAAEAIPVVSQKGSDLACIRAFSPFGFVKEIVQVGGDWEESKLHEQANEYVDDLCERACLIWGFIAASGKLPEHLITQIWARLQTAVYLTLIEGFSRVIHCSTEGRALMALDLASVSSNLRRDAVLERLESFDLPFSPPPVSPRYGKQYVDLYVKVYYYPQEDALNWIAQNCHQYRLPHMLALLSSSGFGGRSGQPNEVYERVKKLYTQVV